MAILQLQNWLIQKIIIMNEAKWSYKNNQLFSIVYLANANFS